MVTGGASVGIPVRLGIGQIGDDGIGSVHNDLVSSPDGVVQALSRQVGVAATQVGEIPGALAAIVFDQFERAVDSSSRSPLAGRSRRGRVAPLHAAAAAIGREQQCLGRDHERVRRDRRADRAGRLLESIPLVGCSPGRADLESTTSKTAMTATAAAIDR